MNHAAHAPLDAPQAIQTPLRDGFESHVGSATFYEQGETHGQNTMRRIDGSSVVEARRLGQRFSTYRRYCASYVRCGRCRTWLCTASNGGRYHHGMDAQTARSQPVANGSTQSVRRLSVPSRTHRGGCEPRLLPSFAYVKHAIVRFDVADKLSVRTVRRHRRIYGGPQPNQTYCIGSKGGTRHPTRSESACRAVRHTRRNGPPHSCVAQATRPSLRYGVTAPVNRLLTCVARAPRYERGATP